MGVTSTNIRIGVTVTDLVAGFKIGSQASSNFSNQLQNDFKRINSFSQAAIVPIKGISSGLREITGVGSEFKSLTSTLGGFFAAEKIIGFGNAIITTSGKFEKFQAVLQNSLGSRSGANQNLNMLSDFAAETPNSLEELTGSFIKFINRGITPTRQQLTNLGDLAASQGKGFDQLTEAVLDAQSGEFERLKEFGVRASKSGDQVTLSFKGVTQTVKNTSEEITNAIYKFGQLGGVAGSMAAVSQTLEGKISNLGDTFDRLLVALSNGGISAAFKDVIDLSQKFLGVVTDLIANSPAEDLQKQKTELNGLVGAIALANDNETVRLSLITQLNQKYPEFLGQLNAESVTTDLLTTRLAAANEQYEKKIRIALGQQAIKKATDDLTASIKSQEGALQQLATASGKSITELEKLSAADRIALARKLGAAQPQQNLGMGVYGGGAFSALATVLEQAGKKQVTAQAELNRLMGENAARQADLTKTTVSGYQQQIAQIREKIRLHQIDAKLGESEIKRLSNLSLSAQGKTPPSPNIKPATITKPGSSPALLDTDNLSIFKRYAEQLKQEIVEIGEDSPKLAEKQQALASINEQIERLNKLTAPTKPISLGKLNPLASIQNSVPDAAKLPDFSPLIRQVEEATNKIVSAYAIMRSSIKGAASDTALDMATDFGKIIGGIATGQQGILSGIIELITDFLANYLSKIATAKLIAGAAILAASIFPPDPPGIAIGTNLIKSGGLLKVASAAVKVIGSALSGGIKGFEKGGLFTSESVIRVGESARALRGGGEFVAPVSLGAQLIAGDIMKRLDSSPRINKDLSRRIASSTSARQPQVMVMGEFRARGSELMAVLEEASDNNYRTGGPQLQFYR